MTDETTPPAMPPASTGAVRPLAWCVISDFYYAPVVSADEDAARRLAKGGDTVLALYPHPPLTDAEREALETAVRMVGDPSPITAPQVFEYVAALRALIARLGGVS